MYPSTQVPKLPKLPELPKLTRLPKLIKVTKVTKLTKQTPEKNKNQIVFGTKIILALISVSRYIRKTLYTCASLHQVQT